MTSTLTFFCPPRRCCSSTSPARGVPKGPPTLRTRLLRAYTASIFRRASFRAASASKNPSTCIPSSRSAHVPLDLQPLSMEPTR